jgi:hypothetical protein
VRCRLRRCGSGLSLIGKEHFAVDGCKLPSNASKQWSGTHEELDDKRKKLERVAERIVSRHRARDGVENDAQAADRDAKKAERYQRTGWRTSKRRSPPAADAHCVLSVYAIPTALRSER